MVVVTDCETLNTEYKLIFRQLFLNVEYRCGPLKFKAASLTLHWKEGNAANKPEKRYNLTTKGSVKCCGILGIMAAKFYVFLVKSCNFCNFALFQEDFWQLICNFGNFMVIV